MSTANSLNQRAGASAARRGLDVLDIGGLHYNPSPQLPFK